MKNILVVVNRDHFSAVPVEFASELAKEMKAVIRVLFIQNIHLGYIPVAPDFPSYIQDSSVVVEKSGIKPGVEVSHTVEGILKESGVLHEFIEEENEPLRKLLQESRYCDLLVMDPQTSPFDRNEGLPSRFTRDVLTSAECPVFLSPTLLEKTEEIIFCYDESASSVFAMKQFTYLFPQFSNCSVTVLEVKQSPAKNINEEQRKIMDWIQGQYPNVSFQTLSGEVKDELFTYLILKRNKIVVMGAFGRNLLSSFFRHSSAEKLIEIVDLPIFIAHH